MQENSNVEKEQEKDISVHRADIREATITEYRKNQIVRIVECVVIAPACIYTGIKYRKQLPAWLSVTLVAVGAATLIYNGRNFYMNWKQDGKLIREAIKQKKEAERKVREQLKKDNGQKEGNQEEKKTEQRKTESTPVQKAEPKQQSNINGPNKAVEKQQAKEPVDNIVEGVVVNGNGNNLSAQEPIAFSKKKGSERVVIPEVSDEIDCTLEGKNFENGNGASQIV